MPLNRRRFSEIASKLALLGPAGLATTSLAASLSSHLTGPNLAKADGPPTGTPMTNASFQPIDLWPAGSPALSGAFKPSLELLHPQPGTPLPCVIVCPGGGYARLAPHEGKPVAEYLASQGFAAAVLSYRHSPDRWPAPFEDATRAIRVLRSRASQLGLTKVAILGFSAGGHLAATVSTQPHYYLSPHDDLAGKMSARPDASVLCYPVISLMEFAHEGSAANLLGQALTPQLRQSFSAHLQVNKGTPPAFLWHTAADAGVPVQNSLLYAQACANMGVPHALHVFSKGRHGLGLAATEPGAAAWPPLMAQWLKEWL